MALRVWMPLNGNLNQQGASSCTLTNNNATVDNNGKIGKCYSFNGSNSYIRTTIPSDMKSIKNTSICVWVKSTSSTGAVGGISHDVGYDLACMTLYNNQWQFVSGSAWKYINAGSYANTSTWHHLACTVDDTTIRTYMDGTLVTSSTISALGALTDLSSSNFIEIGCDRPGGDEMLAGLVNDFRVYDHCLSDKEIKEISKGLCVHLPLNCNGIGKPNMADNTASFSGWSVGSGWTLGTSDNGMKMYSFSRTGATTNNWVRLIPTLKIDGNNYPNGITVSMELLTPDKSAINQKCLGSLQQYDASGTRTGWNEPGWDLTNVVNNQWSKVSYFFNQAALLTNSQGLTYSYTMFSFQLVQNGNISIRKIKIEEGNGTTPYTLSINDMGTITTEIDTSGYGYNGAISGTSYVANTPRYSVSTLFDANADTITLTPFLSNGQTLTEITCSCWFKTNTMNGTAPNIFSLGENSFFRIRLGSASSLWYYIRVGTTQVSSTYDTKTLTDDVWHHVAITFKNGVVVMYLDGAQVGTTDHSATATYLTCSSVGSSWHLAGYTASSENFIGSLSDFRIYATALSADDIKELYQSSASICSNGTLMVYNFMEN